MPIRKSGITGRAIPFGQTEDRPANPELGQPFFNADEARLELYTTATGWQNIVQETPAVVSISGVYAAGNASNTITINGTNFAVGATAYAIGTDGVEIPADTTTLVSVVEVSATFSGLVPANEPYDIKIINPSNLYGVLYEVLQIDDLPVFLTQSGTLGSYLEQSQMSVQVSAVDEESSSLIFSVSSGSLPPGLSINASTGLISGTPSDVIPNTTYSFTVSVTDGNNSSSRGFSITIVDRGPSWATSQTLSSFSKNIQYSETVYAIDDNENVVSYSLVSGSLPDGVSLNSSTGEISGIPTSSQTAIFTIRATDTNSGAYSDRQFTMPNPGPSWQTAANLDSIYISDQPIQLSAIDDSGISPTYAVISGSLPSGMTVSSSGLISGISSSSGVNGQTYSFTVRATDENGINSDRTFSFVYYNTVRLSNWGNATVFTSNNFSLSSTATQVGNDYVVTDSRGYQWKILASFGYGQPSRWGGVRATDVSNSSDTDPTVVSRRSQQASISQLATQVSPGVIYTDASTFSNGSGPGFSNWYNDGASNQAYTDLYSRITGYSGPRLYFDGQNPGDTNGGGVWFEPPVGTAEVMIDFANSHSNGPCAITVFDKTTQQVVNTQIWYGQFAGVNTSAGAINDPASRTVIYTHQPNYVYFNTDHGGTIAGSHYVLYR